MKSGTRRARARVLATLLVLLATVALAACGSREEAAPEPADQGAEAIAAFAPVADILETSCATAACHSTGRGAGGLMLAPDVARGNLVDAASSQQDGATLVVPGDPQASYLMAKLRGDDTIRGARMPIGGAPLSEEEMTVISDWIAAGAGE